MSRPRPSLPSFYVAVWAEADVVKPGYSAATRWRHWENRGANIAILRHFDHYEDAFALETVAFEAMHERWPLAFRSELDSRVLLGRHGGWRETFRAPADDAVRMLIRIADAYADPGCGQSMRAPHGIGGCAGSEKPQVNAQTMRNGCSCHASASCAADAKSAGQTLCDADAYASGDASRARRTNERTNLRTYRSPWESFLALSDACVRVHPGFGCVVT